MRHMVYHAYATISNRQKQFLWTYIMYVLTSATDSFNIRTSLVYLDPALSLCMNMSSNYNGRIAITMYACMQFTRAKTEGSSNARVHTHMSVALSQGSFRACIYIKYLLSVQRYSYKYTINMYIYV